MLTENIEYCQNNEELHLNTSRWFLEKLCIGVEPFTSCKKTTHSPSERTNLFLLHRTLFSIYNIITLYKLLFSFLNCTFKTLHLIWNLPRLFIWQCLSTLGTRLETRRFIKYCLDLWWAFNSASMHIHMHYYTHF